MNTKPKPKEEIKKKYKSDFNQGKLNQSENQEKIEPLFEDKMEEDLLTLHKIHSILLNCINLSKKDKLDFCNSQRYFMKLYLQKMRDQLEKK